MAIKFKIIKTIGILSEGSNGFKKEINIVSWNDRDPKIDVRDWDENHERMRKGITLNKVELKELKRIMENVDPESLDIQ